MIHPQIVQANLINAKAIYEDNQVPFLCEENCFLDQKQYKSLSQLDKLKYMEKAFVRITGQSGCNDLNCCQGLGNEIEIKHDSLSNDSVFGINYETTNCCQEKLKGTLTNLDKNGKIQQNEQILFEFEHNRNCCCLKGSLSSLLSLGRPLFFLMGCLCKSSTSVKNTKDINNRDYKIVYGGFQKRVYIYDSKKNLQYVVKAQCKQWCLPLKQFLVYNEMNQLVNDISLEIQYSSCCNTDKLWTCVKFPKSLDVNLKVSFLQIAAKIDFIV